MNIRSVPLGEIEKKVQLSVLKTGDVFRFGGFTYEEAMTNNNDASFYMVVEITPKKTGRVNIVSMDGKHLLERDESHLVIRHDVELYIKPAETEKG
ncbi:MAG: hypothetical protein WDN09_03830 [bacterium]